MTTRRRKRHSPEQIVRKLRDADAMLNAGKDLAAVLQALEVSEATYDRWRTQYGGMKAEEAKRLKELEEENQRLKELVAELTLDNRMLKHINEETGEPFPEASGGRRACKGSSRSPSEGRARCWNSRGAHSVMSRSHGMTSRRW